MLTRDVESPSLLKKCIFILIAICTRDIANGYVCMTVENVGAYFILPFKTNYSAVFFGVSSRQFSKWKVLFYRKKSKIFLIRSILSKRLLQNSGKFFLTMCTHYNILFIVSWIQKTNIRLLIYRIITKNTQRYNSRRFFGALKNRGFCNSLPSQCRPYIKNL